MIITVKYENEILGSGKFWEGPADRIEEIRNIPAKLLAKQVAEDGKERKAGMWTVSSSAEPTE